MNSPLPTEIHFKKRGNAADYKIAKLVGAGRLVMPDHSVYRVGETLPEDEFDKLVDALLKTVPSPRIEVTLR